MFPATFNLANLDGTNGFKIIGETPYDLSGYSVSSAGDINGDGKADLLIAAPYYISPGIDKAYVVFGGPGIGSNGLFMLSSLNGTNGFKITSGGTTGHNGASVSSAGDVNADGKADLIIGLPNANSATGISYVVFGGTSVGNNGTLALSSLNGTNGFSLLGEAAGDLSGYSVSGASDFNGDNKTDVIIGAPTAISFTGKSYVVFGRTGVGGSGTLALSSLSGTNGFKITGEATGDLCGSSVAAGDINGDGKADLIIGAYGANLNGGTSYVVFGSAGVGSGGMLALSSLTGTNGFSITGEVPNDTSGWSVSNAGDINGDGKTDLIIGASQYNSGGTGKSYVVFGSSGIGSGGTLSLSSLSGSNGFKITDVAAGERVGYSVSSAGDINGDGKADPIIGAPYATSSAGKSYVVFGGPSVGNTGTLALSSLNGTNGFSLIGEAAGDQSGWSVNNVGDINGDGKTDLAIGAPYANSAAGKTYVVFGGGFSASPSVSLTPTATPSISISPSATVSRSFTSTRSTSASPSQTVTQSSSISCTPTISITPSPTTSLSSSITLTPTASVTSGLTPTKSTSLSFSSSVTPTLSLTSSMTASISVTPSIVPFPATFSLTNLDGTNGFTILGEATDDHSGFSVSVAGDINDDGKADLIIGAYTAPYTTEAGKSYIIFGGTNVGGSGTLVLSNLDGNNGFKILGETANDRSGYSVSAAGDINDDGIADLIIGAPYANSGAGKSYVIFGGAGVGINGIFPLSSLTGTNGFVLTGELAADLSGFSVSSAGDINNDGKTDLLIGACRGGAGFTYVVFGSAGVGSSGTLALSSLTGTNGFTIVGEMANDQSGYSVSSVADINGDGITDLLIGAPTANIGGFNTYNGKSYVIFGSANVGNDGTLMLSSLTGTNGFTIIGATYDQSGYSVNSAGDFNGDGKADLIIGASTATVSGVNNVGKSYVVFGGADVGSSGTLVLTNLDGVNGFKIIGEAANDYSGWSVSNAGDINGDNQTDLLIGAPYANSLTGKTYVVFGGSGIGSSGTLALSSLNGTNGFKIPGQRVGDQSGFCVNGIGDVNGDNKVDFMIGAPYANVGFVTQAGKSYVIFGGGFPVSSSPSSSQSLTASISVSASSTISRSFSSAQSISYSRSLSPSISLSPSATVSISNSRTLTPTASLTSGLTPTQSPSQSSSVTPSIAPFPATFNLADLDGTNGFRIIGDTGYGLSGYSVSSAGDINEDGMMDIIIGAPYEITPGLDQSYVIFGSPNIGINGTFLLSSLNGNNGFRIIGTGTTEHSGTSVSSAGDINGDGKADLIIGAPSYVPNNPHFGKSYVVFGGPNIGNNGTLLLSKLNGNNGFVIKGERTNDACGFSVSPAGDINEDGIVDLLIGAYEANTAYVVFGGIAVGNNGTLTLSGLNGSNGFKINDEVASFIGYSVSFAGDINDDGKHDLIIGAYGANNGGGTTYVVFGGVGVGNNGILALSSLNGINGFKMNGEAPNDNSGISVNSAGDINNDGIADLIIGASNANSGAGKSYVVFGGTGIGNTGALPLFSLNGSNGFKINGETASDYSGSSVSSAGDINGDNITDLIIGAPNAVASEASYAGKSYVVFGGSSVGSTGIVALSNLNGSNGFTIMGEGQNNESGFSVRAAGDVNGDGKADLIIGAPYAGSTAGCVKIRNSVVLLRIMSLFSGSLLLIML